MPFVSLKQNAWGHSPEGVRALGGPAKVKEWEKSTDYSKISEKKKPGAIAAGRKQNG